MENDKETISANEINKYTYCEFQWYYERYYGRKYLWALHKQRNFELGLEDKTQSNFNKGNLYHKNYAHKSKFMFKFLLILLIFGGVVFALYYFGFDFNRIFNKIF